MKLLFALKRLIAVNEDTSWGTGDDVKRMLEFAEALENAKALVVEVESTPFKFLLPERKFCSRCGKRNYGPSEIHTCTPPDEELV